MGWASGSQLAESIFAELIDFIPEGARERVAKVILKAFEAEDADDWDASSDLIQYAHPDWLDEEEEE
jgi:hypothetical protein